MPAFHPRIRALTVGFASIALLVVGVGGTVAASTPATLYACFDNYGNVRLSDRNLCQLPGGGRLATINAVGVAGPTGPQGPTGATGPTGPVGATGAADGAAELTAGASLASRTLFSSGGATVVLNCQAGHAPQVVIAFIDPTVAWHRSFEAPGPIYDSQVVPAGPGSTSATINLASGFPTVEVWLTSAATGFHTKVFGVSDATSCWISYSN